MIKRTNRNAPPPRFNLRRTADDDGRFERTQPLRTGEPSEPATDYIIWQILDSAFPTGGFAHSSGLEAARQYAEVRGHDGLAYFIEASLEQLGHAGLPFALAAFDEPGNLPELDALCEAFTNNHVANRASRAQGRALLAAIERIFDVTAQSPDAEIRFAHFAPVFGASLGRLKIPRTITGRIFLFNHLRSALAAAVRLNIVGPMEAQRMQHRLSPGIARILKKCENLPVNEAAQTAPLLDLWQGGQDRLYSRLFQS